MFNLSQDPDREWFLKIKQSQKEWVRPVQVIQTSNLSISVWNEMWKLQAVYNPESEGIPNIKSYNELTLRCISAILLQ